MNKSLTEMFHYNAWANQTLFRALRDLQPTPQQLDTHITGASGSIREIILHIVGAQQTFVLRTMGRQHESELNRTSPWPGIDQLIDLVGDTDRQLIAIAGDLDPEQEIDLPYQGVSYRFPVRFFLVHAFSHSGEHRTELKFALAHMGIDTPDLDAWNYATAAGYGQPVS